MEPGTSRVGEENPVEIQTTDAILRGNLAAFMGAQGIVLFAHGSGSSRHSPRNRFVAEVLQEAGLATLLMDLLTPEEELIDLRTAELRFNVALLARRVEGAVDWLRRDPELARLRVGLFGASTGAAAALIAAAERPEQISAIVSRGGRPDLAENALERVEAPSLLIVGGADGQVIQLNQQAAARLRAPHQLDIIPGAGHLFEEPGTLAQVGERAADWFTRYLTGGTGDRAGTP